MSALPGGSAVTIAYQFWLSGNVRREYILQLDPKSLALLASLPSAPPDWTRLDFNRCPNCPVPPGRLARCPVATNCVEVAEFFRNLKSQEIVDACVETAERKYVRRTSLQVMVGSLLEVVLTTSGCPWLDRFRFLVWTHLPFASLEEQVQRIVSLYLLTQHAIYRRGGEPDWSLRGLLANCRGALTVCEILTRRFAAIRGEGGEFCIGGAADLLNVIRVTTATVEANLSSSPGRGDHVP